MSEEFNIQKDNKRKIEIEKDIFDDINFEDLKNQDLDDLDSGSLNFTKEKVNNIFNDLKSNSSKSNNSEIKIDFFNQKSNTRNEKKKSPSKPSVNINKRKETVPIQQKNQPSLRKNETVKKPVQEPNSVDLGLDILANPSKKREESEHNSIADEQSSESGLGEFEGVKDIMKDDNSEHSNNSRTSSKSTNATELSNFVKEKIGKRGNLTDNQRKEELLYLFAKLEKKGFKLNQKFTMRSPLEDMEIVYARLEHERNVKNSIRFQRKVLMGIVSTLEFVNTSVNPFDIDLEGWSESVMENYTEYDDIFEELYEKYKDKGKISPEVRLLMTLAGSAFYFSLSKTIIKTGQEKMNELFGGGGNRETNGGGLGAMGGLMSGLMNNFMSAGGNDREDVKSNGGMRGPQGFDDILSNKSDDIPSIHSNDSQKRKKRTLVL